ncbi:MAG: hypothetical protein KC731_01770 [Myxococcales bacterium]|nr:hypothetical protein [Myxococcales bacterium]
MFRSAHQGLWLYLLAAGIACSGSATGSETQPEPEPEPETQLERDCKAMCDSALTIPDCEDESCKLRCMRDVEASGDCAAVAQDYVACLGREGLTSCVEVPVACNGPFESWRGCNQDGGCGPVICDIPEGAHCQCNAVCGNASSEVVETCVAADGGGFDCTCEVDGELVATCTAQQRSCAFFIGCCMDALQALP